MIAFDAMIYKSHDKPVFRQLLAVTLLVCAALHSGTAAADLTQTRTFNIAPQLLQEALIEYTAQSGVQVTSAAEIITGKGSTGVTGLLPSRNALETLLKGTALTYDVINDNTVTIRPVKPASAAVSTTENGSGAVHFARSEGSSSSSYEGADNGDRNGVSASEERISKKDIAEIIVTAQKREERLQDVPVPVTVVDSQTLVNSNQLRLQDYAVRIPGLAIVPLGGAGGARTEITLRGLSTGEGTSTVAVTVDGVPFRSDTLFGGSSWVPDLDPGDFARIEVLRGPQGTLYGASSLGGLINYVTVDPSIEGVSGRLSLGTASVTNGNTLGYNARASVNVPLDDSLAIGISGFSRMEPGYIDNDVLGIQGVNEQQVNGGRLVTLWRLADDWALRVGAVNQHHISDGAISSDVTLGSLKQNVPRGVNRFGKNLSSYSANLQGKLGTVDFTSISAYNLEKTDDSFDISFFGSLFGGADYVVQNFNNHVARYTQEIRLGVPLWHRVEALLGGFYTRQKTRYFSTADAIDYFTGAAIAPEFVFAEGIEAEFEERSVFSTLTVQFTDRFDVQLGGRMAWIDQLVDSRTTQSIFFGGGEPVTAPSNPLLADTNAFTYLLAPRFKVSPDLMLYGRMASGYRAGGPNGSACNEIGFPCQYSPDKSQNFELGAKGGFLGHALLVDASIYYIPWKDIQLGLRDGAFSWLANAGRARSHGVELSVETRPLDGLTIAGWVAWNVAELTEDSTLGRRGNRLPFGAEWSGRLSVKKDFDLANLWSGFVEGSGNYMGERGAFIGSRTDLLQNYPAYTKYDLNVGVQSPSNTWSVNLFVNNVTDKRATHTGNPAQGTVIYIQPRTVGVNLTREF